jgi:cell division protein FtsA
MASGAYIVVLDIGSSNIRSIIAQIIPDDKPRVVGVGSAPSNGMRRGIVADLEEVSQSIRASIEEAQLISGVKVESVYISVGGGHISCVPARGVIAVGRADGEVTEEDIGRVLDASQAVSLLPNQEILHVIPQGFSLDNQDGIKDPLGMNGVRLEMKGMLIVGSTPHLKNISKCVHNCGLDVEGFVVAPLAAAKAVLNKRQKELGVVMIDIGGGTTSVAVYEEGELVHLIVLPIGSSHITNDIAIGLRTSIDVAEKVKIEYGSAIPSEISKDTQINLAEIDAQEEGSVSRHHVAEIIEARLEEMFILIEKELTKINRSALLPAGAVLTGGGARLHGTVDLAKDIFKLPAQTGFPFELSGLIDKVDNPSFSVAVGMILWSLENEHNFASSSFKDRDKSKSANWNNSMSPVKHTVSGVKKWFDKFLP